jgi:hypothetical protein
MTDLTHAFPDVVVANQSPSAVLFVDSDVLIKFQKVGALDALLTANRTIYITPEVFNDAVTKAVANANPAVVASGLALGAWINQVFRYSLFRCPNSLFVEMFSLLKFCRELFEEPLQHDSFLVRKWP